MTNFEKITQSPEILADYMVNQIFNQVGRMNVMYNLNISLKEAKRFKKDELRKCLKYLNQTAGSVGDGE